MSCFRVCIKNAWSGMNSVGTGQHSQLQEESATM